MVEIGRCSQMAFTGTDLIRLRANKSLVTILQREHSHHRRAMTLVVVPQAISYASGLFQAAVA